MSTKEQAHTAGPWRFEDGSVEHAESGMRICRVSSSDDFPCLTESEDKTEAEVRAKVDAECEANGRLIAAAPDLHSALIAAKCEMWMMARHKWTMADFKNCAVVQQIDAALEKADGNIRTAASIAAFEATRATGAAK